MADEMDEGQEGQKGQDSKQGGQAIVLREAPLAFVGGQIVEAAQSYLSITGLPKEALPSVIQAVSSHFGLKKQVRRELRATPEKKRAMVGVPQGKVLTDIKLREVEEFSRINSFPMSTLYITQQNTVAVKAVGWRARAHADPRILKGFENIKFARSEEGGNVALYECSGDIVFWTGERYPALGAASSDEPRASRTPVAFLKLIAETRMQTRAIRLALGLPFEVAEDVMAGEEARETEPQAKAAPQQPGEVSPIRNAADLLARAQAEYGLRRADVLAQLGKSRLEEIQDFDAAFGQLKRK